MRRFRVHSVVLLALTALPQIASAGDGENDATVTVDLRAEILVAIELPTLAHRLRTDGVPDEEVHGALEACRGHELHAGQTGAALAASLAAVEERGPVENFGAFVRTELKAGKRGKKLAKAIRAEHKKRGIGKGKRIRLAQQDGPANVDRDDDGPPGKAKGHDKPKKEPPSKAKADDKPKKGPPSKAKDKHKHKDKHKDKPKKNHKAKAKAKGKGKKGK